MDCRISALKLWYSASSISVDMRINSLPVSRNSTELKVFLAYTSALELTNGETIKRDLTLYLSGPIFESIRSDSVEFAKLYVDTGTVVWPNGADLCPDVLIFGGLPPGSHAQPRSWRGVCFNA